MRSCGRCGLVLGQRRDLHVCSNRLELARLKDRIRELTQMNVTLVKEATTLAFEVTRLKNRPVGDAELAARNIHLAGEIERLRGIIYATSSL